MTRKSSRITAALASVAAFSMAATPAMAQGWGWGGGWGGHHYRHRDRVDAGDILTGILIIGGIAAIASAASNSSKNDRRRVEERRYPDQEYPRQRSADYGQDNRPEWRERSGNGSASGVNIDDAVNACIDEVARGSARVEAVDQVNREGQGWRVQGKTIKGGDFACAVDGSGRVRDVSVDGKAY